MLHERGKLADAENLLRRVLGNVAAVASEHVPNFTTSKDSYTKLHLTGGMPDSCAPISD